MPPVQLYVYDMTRGMARVLSPQLIGMQLDGIWHTGVVVYGKEYFFGGGGSISGNMAGVNSVGNVNLSGVKYCVPGTTILGQPGQVLELGVTEVPESLLTEYLDELADSTFRMDSYSLFEHNCNHFSNELSEFLTGNKIPDHIVNLPQQVLNTPMGAMIRSMMGGQMM